MLVEDEPKVRAIVRRGLEARGYVVEEVTTCAAATDLMGRAPPDVVVLDYELPDGTALQLLPRLRAADPTLPAIILTGQGSIELAVRAILKVGHTRDASRAPSRPARSGYGLRRAIRARFGTCAPICRARV